jgi:hypothetical protein
VIAPERRGLLIGYRPRSEAAFVGASVTYFTFKFPAAPFFYRKASGPDQRFCPSRVKKSGIGSGRILMTTLDKPVRGSAMRRFFGSFWVAIVMLTTALPTAAQPVPEPSRADSAARLLAGLPATHPSHQRVMQFEAWREHRSALPAQWAEVKSARAGAIVKWRDEALTADCPAGRTLLYPFSGPDFLNAYLFFPRCETYVMFGLERPGTVPAFETMSASETERLLADVRTAVGDLLERNYFITSHMTKQLTTPHLKGVLPVMLAAMALVGVRVDSVEPFDFWSAQGFDPTAAGMAKPARRMRAVKVTFTRPAATQPQTLYYFSLDATDRALRSNPEFLPFLASHKPATVFLKSASYLLHSPHFIRVRNVLLDSGEVLLQDDTGMPYRILRDRGWNVTLFGRYSRPVQCFNYGFQPDLDAAYREMLPPELPFPFSYHWQQGESNLLIARKGPPRQVSLSTPRDARAPVRAD